MLLASTISIITWLNLCASILVIVNPNSRIISCVILRAIFFCRPNLFRPKKNSATFFRRFLRPFQARSSFVPPSLILSKKIKIKWNVTPLIRRGSNFFHLQHFIAPTLDVIPCLQAQGRRDCNKGIMFKQNHLLLWKEKYLPQY